MKNSGLSATEATPVLAEAVLRASPRYRPRTPNVEGRTAASKAVSFTRRPQQQVNVIRAPRGPAHRHRVTFPGYSTTNIFARTTEGFSIADEAIGMDLATAVAIVLANASAYWGAFNLGEQHCEAMASRAEIEQAKGILMAQSPGINADDAFEILRRASPRENVKLRDIARRLVTSRSMSAEEE